MEGDGGPEWGHWSTARSALKGRYRELLAMIEERDKLLLQVSEYRKLLWVLARKEGLSLAIPKAELDSVPAEAELLVWYEKLFDSMMLKGICSTINQPDLAKPVTEKPKGEIGGRGNCDECGALVEHLYSFRCPACYDMLVAGMENRKLECPRCGGDQYLQPCSECKQE